MLASLVGATTVSAIASDGPAFEPQFGEPHSGVEPAKSTLAGAAGIDALQRLRTRALEAEATRQASLRSPAERTERLESRTEFKAMAAGEVAALFESEFGALLDELAVDSERLADGGRVAGFLDDYTMRVDRPGTARDALVESPFPLRVPDERGVDAPVDLALESRSGTLVAANPLVDVALPDRLEDGAEVGGVRLFPAAQASSEAELLDGGEAVLYHEAVVDTDVILAPVTTGLEASWLVRSPEAPAQQRLRFALPPGGEIVIAPDGGADLVHGETRLGRVLPARALDADGTEVEVSYETEDDTLVLNVEHRDRDLKYPIWVDPVVEDWLGPGQTNSWYHGYGYAGLGDWYFHTNQSAPAAPFAPRTECYAPISCYKPAATTAPPYGRGLYVYTYPQQAIAAGTTAHWGYSAPGTTTQISSAVLGPSFYTRRGASQDPFVYMGIWAEGIADWTDVVHAVSDDLAGSFATLTAGATLPNSGHNQLAVGFYTGANVTLSAWRDLAVGGATISLVDPEIPTVTAMGQSGPGGWTADGEFTVAPTLSDPGLGVKSARLSIPATDGAVTQTRSHPCTGVRASPCPASITLGPNAAFAYSAGDADPSTAGDQPMPEGVNTVGLVATDILGKDSATATATVKVDRGAPALEVSGDLWDRRESDPPPSQGVPMPAGVHGLSVEADDPAAGQAPQGTRAGVERIEVEVDGQSVEIDEGPCAAGNCSRTLQWEFDTDEHEAGRHTIDVSASDGAGNEATERFTVFVPEPPPDAPPLPETDTAPLSEATEFIYTGPDPMQTGVAPGTIDPERSAVIRGFIKSRSGDPIEGAGVSVAGHPEYGATTTHANGEFFMAVDGGAPLVVRLEKEGHLPVDRQVVVPWQDYVWIEEAVLTPLDTNATEIDLSSPLSPAQVARGNPVTDADGSRQATLIFPAGTSAEMVMPNGTELPLEELTVRATEYTVGAEGMSAMPAELPPTSGYTYAAEYSVDEAMAAGAEEVRFSQPVANYTENFLGFPVGEAVPTGYYDRERAAWVGAPNGRVVEILSESGGLAVLDVSGAGQPATANELAGLGVTDDERAKLAELYEPGATLWRVQMEHFSSWDHNWPWGPPLDALPPWLRLPPLPVDESCVTGGSVIQCENQVLGEDLPLTGSEQKLHYRSDRVPGRTAARQIDIPLVGDTYSQQLEAVELTVTVAGQRFHQSFEPAPDLSYTYEWDGLDAFRRRVNGAQPATITIHYVYGLVAYQGAGAWESAWGRTGQSGPSLATRPAKVRLSQSMETMVGGYTAPPSDLGGWTLSAHHRFDTGGRSLYLGDGRRRTAHNIGLLTERVAGDMSGAGESSGDGGPARDAVMSSPEDVAVGPDGSVYFTDSNNARIRKVDPDGTIHTIAGTGEFRGYAEPAGDGGPATSAELDFPYGLDVGPDGSVYFSDWNRVRKVDPAGIVTTVAGHEVNAANDPDFAGDGGLATEAHLNIADAVTVARDGSLYIADYGNHRVRHVGTDGIITTVAGTGVSGYSGDGGSAQDAQLSHPEDVEVGADGSVYIADAGNARVRQVRPNGVIATVAGNGQHDPPSWGVTAVSTAIEPKNIALDDRGALLVTTNSATVGRVDGDRILRKVAGIECAGPDCVFDSDDGALAPNAAIGCPWGLATGHADDVYLTDVCDHTIRRLKQALPGFDGSDVAIPSEDGSEIFRFDATGRHLETRDALTGSLRYSFAYDGAGRLTEVEDGDALVTAIERDGSGRPTAITAPFGRRTTVGTGANGYLDSVVNPADEETVFGYGSAGLLTSLLEPGGGETAFSYDSGGRLTRDTDASGGFKDLSRTVADGRAEVTLETKLGRTSKYEVERLQDDDTRRTWTDPSGFERTLDRHKDGRDEVAYPDGTAQELTSAGDPRFGMQSPLRDSVAIETPAGRRIEAHVSREATLSEPGNPLSLTELEQSVEVNGRTSTTVFDSALSRFTLASPTGRTATATVDSQQRPTETAVPGIAPVSYVRDSYGRVEEVAQGSRTAQFAYDALGRLDTVTDALDREHGFEYDAADRVVREILPDLREIGFGYDDDGNLTSVTPPSRPSHAFDHTAVGLTESYTPPDLGSGPQPTLFDWNDDRDLTKITKPGGREIDFGYDAGGRLATVTHSRGQVQVAYDGQTGNVASVTAPGGEQTAFAFDGSLPVGETVSGTVAGQISRTFDDDFELTSESIDGSHAVGFNYDDDGLLTQAGGLTLDRNLQNGLLIGTTLGQIDTTIGLNGFGEPQSVGAVHGATGLYEETYQRDDLGRITQKTERRGTQTTTYDYGYDQAGRLETVHENAQLAATYSYDANGNRTGVTRQGQLPITAQYDAQDRLTSYGAATYAHDASGQFESKTEGGQTTTYEYDDLGALMQVGLPNGTDIDYAVDASGRRIAKKRNGQLEQGFLYGQGIAPLAELNPNGTVKSRFVYATRSNVPDYMVRGGQTYRIITDQLGSPRAVVDSSSGAIAQEMDFDEFGRVTRDTNPGFQPFGYAGGLYDADTGLVRFGARDYDAETGRWTAKDPIGFVGGDANLYGYVLGDPVNWYDPSGLFLSEVAGAIDAVTPDVVSNAAAGVIDGATGGLASSAMGVGSWCGAPGYGTGALLAPGPGRLVKGVRAVGISKTVRVDRAGRPIPEPRDLGSRLGDPAEARTKAAQLSQRHLDNAGSSSTQNKRAVAEGWRAFADALSDVGF